MPTSNLAKATHVAPRGSAERQCDNDNRKYYKYVCITTYQPYPKYNPNPNPNPNPTTKQHAIVNIQINTVTCPTCPDKFIRDNVGGPSVPLSIVIVTQPHSNVRR